LKFLIAERRFAPRRIPGVDQAEYELVVAAVSEEMPGDFCGRLVAIFGDRLARQLGPDIGRQRLADGARFGG
jgi:hypothetical protein